MQGEMEETSLRKILLCLKKFCTEKVCFQGLPPDELVAGFQNVTNHMLAEEMKKKSPNLENAETLAANYTLVMTNAMSNKCKEKRQLFFVTDNYDTGAAKLAIDNQFKLSWKYKTAEMVMKRNKKRRKILVSALIIFLSLAIIALGCSFILNDNASQAQKTANDLEQGKNLYERVFPTAKDSAIARNIQQAENSKNMSRILGIVGVAVFTLLIVGIIAVSSAIKRSRKVLNDWEDYQFLCGFLESSVRKAMEAKRLWPY